MISRVKHRASAVLLHAVRRGVVPTQRALEQEIGEAKRLLAEYVSDAIAPMAHDAAHNRDRLIEQQHDLARVGGLQHEGLSYVAEELRRVSEALEHLDAGRLTAPAIVTRLAEGDPGAVDEDLADVLNAATSSVGALARRGLFFNLAPWVTWEAGGPKLEGVNERIAEIPYVFGALADLGPGSRILDIGSAESTVPASLATLGHHVTALDPRGYPLPHPNLEVVTRRFDELTGEGQEPFDAVVSLSSVEHFGLAAYPGDTTVESADRDAVVHVRKLLAPDGRFVLTVPYGRPRTTQLERIYGPAELDALLEGFTITDKVVLHRNDATSWVIGEDLDRPGCAMLVARPA